MTLVRYCASRVAETLDKVAEVRPPTEFEVQLSIKLDAELGAILAKASAEAQLQVTMRWSRPQR
jgi:Trypsin-co-occurring domain 1